MKSGTPLQGAREILARDVLGLEEIRSVFGAVEGIDPTAATTVPFSTAELELAKRAGEFLVLRAARASGEPLTLLRLIRQFPDAFDRSFLDKMGYQLKSEWGIALEPLAAVDTCRPQWALVRKHIWEETQNLAYEEQALRLQAYGAQHAGRGMVRRRTAVEIAFDVIAYHRVRGVRLLHDSWDWSSSHTVDGGYLNLGHFDEKGMQVFAYSPGVRHGKLGVCPNRDP